MEPHLSAADVEKLIVSQVEFYFSEVNLATDPHFMKNRSIGKRKWISCSYILRCNRVKKMLKEFTGGKCKRSRIRALQRILLSSSEVVMKNKKLKRKRKLPVRFKERVLKISAINWCGEALNALINESQYGKVQTKVLEKKKESFVYFCEKSTTEVSQLKEILNEREYEYNGIKFKLNVSKLMEETPLSVENHE